MAGEAYQVDYIINLQDNASAGIMTFSKAASKLTKAASDIEKFKTTFNQVVAQFDKPLKMSINTQNAHKSLDKILTKIKKIQTEAGKINVGAVGGAVGNAANKKVVTTTVTTQTTQTARAKQPQGPRPIVAPKGRQPLVPRNLEYQVLGPTRLGNVAMLDMFKGMGVMYGISAIGSGMRDIISQSTEYENIMQTAKNILKTNYKGGNFNASFNDMERIVREVGVETKFTAPEVADAVKFLAMAGLDINAINKSIRPIADIALIGDTDLGQTADVMTNIMTAYGIKPDDMRKTADVMTRTFTMSNTTLLELAESFKMAGSMLHLANVPFETAAAAFGVLGDAGIKATMAGTTMRTIMNNLRNPTKNQQKYWDMLQVRRYDDFGNLREINDIFGDLFRLNNNNERKEEATKAYEDLQKKYATRFEGLQEGSDEWKKAWGDYDKESEAIRKQFGGVDVFRLFRLTAASGAGVLMNSVEKWNKIIEENFLSDGLSQKLADEKKNTIAGMWAQLKSAFQEGGLKVFEENDGRIRGYLQRGISWLKSDEFTKILRSVIDLIADLGGTLIWFTEKVVTLYNKFSPLIKSFLKFQLYLKGIQIIIGSFRQFGNAALYTALPLLSRLSGRKMPIVAPSNQAMTGLGGIASASGIGTGALGGLLYYGIPQKWMGNGYSALLETGDPWQAVKADKNYQKSGFGAVANNRRLLNKYTVSNKRIQAFNRNAGWSSALGGIAGSYLGSAIAPESEWAGAIGGISGSLGAMALSSMAVPGAGWIAAGVIGAAAATAAVVNHVREIKKATTAAHAYTDAMKKLDTSAWNVGTSRDMFIASMKIRSSELLSESEKLEKGIELWRRYYKAAAGEDAETDMKSSSFLYDADESFKTLVDNMTGKKGKKFRDETINDFSKENITAVAGNLAVSMFDYLPESIYSPANTTQEQRIGELKLQFSKYTDANAAILTAWQNYKSKDGKIADKVLSWKADALTAPGSLGDMQAQVEKFRKEFMTPSGEFLTLFEESNLNGEYFKTHSGIGDLLRLPSFYALMIPQFEAEIQKYQRDMTEYLTGGGSVESFLGLFGEGYGLPHNGEIFGGKNFNARFRQHFVDLFPGDDIKQRDAEIKAFQDLVDLFNKSNNFNKAAMLPLLNKSYWESVFPGLDLSNVYGGFYAPDEKGNHPYKEQGVKWDDGKHYFMLDGHPWYNGNSIIPKEVNDISLNQSAEQSQTPTPETAMTNAADSLQAYKQPMIVPMWPEVPAQSAEQTEKKETPVPIIKMDMPYLFYKYPWENGASMIAETMRSEREQTLGAFTKNTENMSGTFQAYTAPVIQMYPEAQAVGRKDDTDGASVIGYGLYDRLSQLFNDKHQFVPFNMEEYGMVTAQLQTPYYNPYYNGENGIPQPVLPSDRAVNEALALAESGICVKPNVTKNNTYTFTFHIENLRTDMDEDQLSQYIEERIIPAFIDKLDHSYEGSLSA